MVVVAPLAPTGTSPAWNDAWFIGVAAPVVPRAVSNGYVLEPNTLKM